MFSTKGVFVVDAATVSEDRLMEVVLEAGAEDLERDDDSFRVTCEPAAFEAVKNALEKAGIGTELAEIQRVPSQSVPVEGKNARRVLDLVATLEDHDDVQNVYANFDMDEEVMEEMLAAQ
jgi:transcriptional/translational regulatory protein YebC/TACO1